jgi:hypothetical protein
VTEALLVGAGVLVILALAGFAILASRRQGSAEADRSRLTEDIDRATQANQARASVDRLDDAAVRDELRKFQRD